MHLSKCKICKEVHAHLNVLSKKYPSYHCKPVSGSGNINSKICLVGLAPGLHGANKTGIPFTSDHSGQIIRSILDELNLNNIYITNIVRCYPQKNKPSLSTINNCQKYNNYELNKLPNLKVIITLGEKAYKQIGKLFQILKTNKKFIHGNLIHINEKICLISSYHCSKLNFNTHRINRNMLKNIFLKAKKIINNE